MILFIGSLAGVSLPGTGGAVFGISCAPAFSGTKTAAEIEAEYNKETNPGRRVKLAVELADEKLNRMLVSFQASDPADEPKATDAYLASLDRLEKALEANAGHGASKDTEIHLRRQTLSLRKLRPSVALDERTLVDTALARATQLHEQVLYSIMSPKRKP